MKKWLNNRNWKGITSVMSIVLCLIIGLSGAMFSNPGAINEALGIKSSASVGDGEFTYKTAYTSDGKPSDEGLAALIKDELDFCKRELEEGSVLLENDGALPLLSSERRVTLFGRASADPVYRGGSGGAGLNKTYSYDWEKALTEAGFSINKTLYDLYAQSAYKRVMIEDATADIGECPKSFYDSKVKATYATDYKDAAIVIISRMTGEGHDASTSDKNGLPLLALHEQEKDMLAEVMGAGFKKVIVVINSACPIEVEEIKSFGVNAILWIGLPGYYGLPGVASILKGEANPSGRLVDTYATNSLSSPAMMNWGDYSFTDDEKAKFVVELEGIYAGYKYYETRYEDAVLSQGNATGNAGVYASKGNSWNYADEVSYTFGYGLSYTNFTQEFVKDEGGASYSYDAEKDEFIFNVKVTNVGGVAGKSVVQIYAQQPYTEYDKLNLVEKSSIQIVGYAKTALLAANSSEIVTISLPRYNLTSYDDNAAKTYILDAGDYYFAIGADAHDALNNILALKGAYGMFDADGNTVAGDASKAAVYSLGQIDKTTYSTSSYTGVEVTNRFDDIDVNYYYKTPVVTYLSRQDWQGTYPVTVVLTMNEKIKNARNMETYSGTPTTPLSSVTYANDKGIKFADMVGVSLDTEEGQAKWLEFVQQLDINDLAKGTGDQFATRAIKAVGKPAATHSEGPDGISVAYEYGDKGKSLAGCTTVVLASSWNKELIYENGKFEAENAIYCHVSAFFSPGANVHRSPYLGRYHDYWSEDGLFNSMTITQTVKALSDNGMISCMKHFCANDMEWNRGGVCTFMTEQRFRQESLKSFEGPFTDGGSLGVMSSYNRIGCTQTQCSYELLYGVMRGEWGFKGICITDAAGESPTSPTVEAVMAGTTLFCENYRESTLKKVISNNQDGDIVLRLQEANMYNLYAYANSNLINGLTNDSEVVETVYWWIPTMISLIVVLGVVTAGSLTMYVLCEYVIKAKEEEKPND